MKVRGIEISHPDKPMYPGLGITKGDVARFYDKIADRMLPYLRDRPLTLRRFPDGIGKGGFYQKHAQDYYPEFIERVEVDTEQGSSVEILCSNKESLVYLANQGALCYHVWLSRRDKLTYPDKVVFDLDPPENGFEKVKQAAQRIGTYLRERDREPRLMTTGKSGLHVFYEMRRTADFDRTRQEVRQMAEELARQHPDLLTTAIRKNKREGRVFIDYLRNAYGQTSVCPYSLRANRTAGVATLLEWGELDRVSSGDQYHFKNIFRRLAAKGE